MKYSALLFDVGGSVTKHTRRVLSQLSCPRLTVALNISCNMFDRLAPQHV